MPEGILPQEWKTVIGSYEALKEVSLNPEDPRRKALYNLVRTGDVKPEYLSLDLETRARSAALRGVGRSGAPGRIDDFSREIDEKKHILGFLFDVALELHIRYRTLMTRGVLVGVGDYLQRADYDEEGLEKFEAASGERIRILLEVERDYAANP